MKVIFVATTVTVAFISLSLTRATLAAPTQWKIDMKNQLLKSLISQALVQQQDSPSTEDKEMVASFCKILIQILNHFNLFEEESLDGDNSEDDYCEDFELPPEPRPEDRSTTLAKAYQTFFNLLKNSGIEKAFGEFNKLRNIIG